MGCCDWLNTTIVTHPDIAKPCIKLGYCPYGQLVEEFPFSEADKIGNDTARGPLSCSLENGALVAFGHDCPVHYLAEFIEKEGEQ